MSCDPDLEKLPALVGAWAEEVAALQREGQRTRHFSIETKASVYDFVTDIDRRSEKLLRDAILKEFPGHGILAEEGTRIPGDQDYRWIIDPLDGTSNYINGHPVYAISIHLERHGRGLFSLVKAPALNLCFTALRGEGTFLNAAEVHASVKNSLQSCLIGTGFPLGRGLSSDQMAFLNALMAGSMGIRRTGSAALDLAFVAAGWLDGFWEFNLHPWDYAAGYFLVEEAGGDISLTGTPDGTLLIAGGNKEIHNCLKSFYRRPRP